MLARITAVRPTGDYRLHLTFADGRAGEIDLRGQIVGRGGVFQILEDRAFFNQVRVDTEAGTIAWPNEVDLDSDVLYSLVTGIPVADLVQAAMSHD